MNYKKIGKKLLAAFLGIVVFGYIVSLIVDFVSTCYLAIFLPGWPNDAVAIIFFLIGLSVIIGGIYLGLRSYKKKNIWYKVFRPEKKAMLISLILAVILLIFFLITSKGVIINLFNFKPVPLIWAIPLVIINYFIAFYPFSALCTAVRKKKIFKKSRLLIILLLILLNPVFIVCSEYMTALYIHAMLKEPCGVKILAMTEPSPAKEAGIQLKENIVRINDFEIKTRDDLFEYMDKHNSPSELVIHTDFGVYNVKPVLSGGRYRIGVVGITQLCNRSFG